VAGAALFAGALTGSRPKLHTYDVYATVGALVVMMKPTENRQRANGPIG
jgi:hypothetical protein